MILTNKKQLTAAAFGNPRKTFSDISTFLKTFFEFFFQTFSNYKL